MKQTLIVALAGVIMALSSVRAADSEEGFTTIFDGKSFTGWKTSLDNTNTWKIEDGAFVARGAVAHVFYIGDTNPFKNFELKVDVMTEPSANGGHLFPYGVPGEGISESGYRMPGECEPHGLDQDGESLWIGEFWADAGEGQPMVDTAYHCSRAEGDGKDRWQNSDRVQRAAGEPDRPREKIGRRVLSHCRRTIPKALFTTRTSG